MRFSRFLLLILLGLVLTGTQAWAFHDGGVADCAGCHTMHNSQDGLQVANVPEGNAHLLIDGNSSDVCLRCHASYGQFDNGEGYGPGGDFYWLTKTYTWSAHGNASSSPGDSHGHNVISPANLLVQDATLDEAPGGDFMSERLTCTSCHDPHGNSSFRILYGTAVGPIYDGIRYDFTEPAPLAAGNTRKTNSGDGGEETNANHTVYKSGMSEWCSNCHTDFHSDNTTNFVHATGDNLGSTIAGIYNAYVSSDSLSGGSSADAYNGLVPFEDVDVDLDTVDTSDYTTGPNGNDQVMCLTCHRSHASPFQDIGRWDFTETFMAESHPATGDGGLGANDLTHKWYEYVLSTNQRSLCNKCHVKDLGDAEL